MAIREPVRFQPVYMNYLWGGDRIGRRFHRVVPEGRCAESWEIADRPEGMSRVTTGPYAGQNLHELVCRFGPSLIGREFSGSVFPLLVKIIDATQRLSLQVHPDETTAPRLGGEAKSEMWYVLDAEPGAVVFVGFKENITEAVFRRSLENRSVENLLQKIPIRAGDAVFIPGGLVHAIGEGCLLLEIQQNSNTTYRVYDWDRIGPDGKPRELHLEKALKAINWTVGESPLAHPGPVESHSAYDCQSILRSPFFDLERLHIQAACGFACDGSSFHGLFTARGIVRMVTNDSDCALEEGSTVLVPAECPSYRLIPEAAAEVLRFSVPASAGQ